jgi:ferric-dicitrate binding protein FerR (iron transport regulator)
LGKTKHIDLPDGSKVELNGGSTLHASADFGKDARKLQLEGEAFFDVAKDKERPFVVSIGNTTSEALGTQFNLRLASKSKVVQLSVVEGKVKFAEGGKKQEMVLVAGQVAEFDPATGKIWEVQRSAEDQSAWRKNQLFFEDESFPVAAEVLERHFGVRITYPERLNTARLTAKFEQRALPQVLEVIESIYNVKATQSADAVSLTDL